MSFPARRRAWAPRSRRLPVAALTATLALLATPFAAVGPAAGAAGSRSADVGYAVRAAAEDGLRIVVDAVDPVVLRPGSPARVTGRVVNDGSSAVRLGGVTLTASTSLLGSRREVADWVEGGVDRSTDWVLGDDTVGPLVPGDGEVGFSVTVPGDSLESLPDGPAALAVRVTAGVDGDSAPAADDLPGAEDLAELRTVLTSAGDRAIDVPLEVSWVVPLTLPPDPGLVDPDPTVHAQAWTDAVGAGSPVRGWLDHLSVPDVTWLVDPSLLVAPRPAPSVAAATVDEPEETEDPEEPQETDGPAETEDPRATEAPDDTARTAGPPGDDAARTSDPDAAATTGPAPAPVPAPDDAATTTGPAPPPQDDGPRDRLPEEQDVEEALIAVRERLADLPSEQLWWLPTGDPDLARLAADDLPVPRDRARQLVLRELPPDLVTPALATLLGSGRHHVLWPALAGPTSDDLARILSLYPAAGADGPDTPPDVVVVPRDSFTASSAAGPRRGAVPVTDSDVVAVGVDSWTTALVAGGAAQVEEAGAGAVTQRLLAHTLGTWLEAPTSPRELVVAPPRGTPAAPEVLDQLSRAWSDADWLTTVPAEDVVGRATDGGPVSLSGTPAQEAVLGGLAALLVPGDSPVDASRGRSLVSLEDDLDGLSEVLADTDALRSWRPALAGLWSTRWRQDPSEWPATWRTLRADVRDTRRSVHIAPSNVNFIADQGTIQITVVNDLPVAVEDVQLSVTTTNNRLQVLRQPDAVSVGPGSRANVPFDARALTRGDVTLVVELTTPGGTELGVGERIAVRVQPTGVWIYWVLGGLAGVVLVLGLARALRSAPRVPRGTGAGGAAYPEPGPDPGPREEEHP